MTHAPEEIAMTTRAGLELRALAWGPATAPPALALHGWLDNASSFEALAPRLPGRRLIALDLPGHGRSAHLDRAAGRHFIDWLPLVTDAMDALELERPDLIGHSMGGAIAGMIAGACPERARRLVMIEGFAPRVTEAEESLAQLRRGLKSRARALERAPAAVEDLDEAVARMLQARMPMGEDGARAIAQRNLREDPDGRSFFGYDPLLQTSSLLRVTAGHVTAWLSAIEAPTLLIRAEQGWPVDPAYAERLLGLIQDLRVEVLDGGHHLHLDDPAPVASHIQRFWQAHASEEP